MVNIASGDSRLARIFAIRRQLAAGTYETPEKLQQALEIAASIGQTDQATADQVQQSARRRAK